MSKNQNRKLGIVQKLKQAKSNRTGAVACQMGTAVLRPRVLEHFGAQRLELQCRGPWTTSFMVLGRRHYNPSSPSNLGPFPLHYI